MTDLERRHRKATDKIARWCAAANNARAMGEVTSLHAHGSALVRMAEICMLSMHCGPEVAPGCRCEVCVLGWELAVHNVEHIAREAGVDPKRHRFGALQRMAAA